MKIAIFTHRLTPPLIGGVDVLSDRLGRAFAGLGHAVHFVAFDRSGPGQPKITEDHHSGHPVVRVRFSLDDLPKISLDTLYDPVFGQVAKQILTELQPDLVVIMNFYLITTAPISVAAELGIPVIHIATDFLPICRRGTYLRWDGSTCEVGESLKNCASCFVSEQLPGRIASRILAAVPESSLLRWAGETENFHPGDPRRSITPYLQHIRIQNQRLINTRQIREQISAVFCPTEFTRSVFLQNGYLPDQVHHLPFGVDPIESEGVLNKTPADHVRFLFIGRLQPYKGLHLALDAFCDLEPDSGAKLTVYGAADQYDDYADQIVSRIRSTKNAYFKNTLPPELLHTAFEETDIFLLPSTWHENLPLIVLDSLQSKTPLIASDIGGIAGVVEHGKNGLLFPRGDSQALKRLMQQVIDDPDLITSLRNGTALLSSKDYAKKILESVGMVEEEFS